MIVSLQKVAQHGERLVPRKGQLQCHHQKKDMDTDQEKATSSRPRPSQLESQFCESLDKVFESMKLSVSSVK